MSSLRDAATGSHLLFHESGPTSSALSPPSLRCWVLFINVIESMLNYVTSSAWQTNWQTCTESISCLRLLLMTGFLYWGNRYKQVHTYQTWAFISRKCSLLCALVVGPFRLRVPSDGAESMLFIRFLWFHCRWCRGIHILRLQGEKCHVGVLASMVISANTFLCFVESND